MQMKHLKVAVKQERAVGSGEVLGVKIELFKLWCWMHKAENINSALGSG